MEYYEQAELETEEEENEKEEVEMNTAKEQRKIFLTIGCIILLVIIVIFGVTYFSGYKKAETKYMEEIARLEEELENRVVVYEEVTTEVDISVIKEQIHNIGELATVEYIYTDAGKFSDIDEWFGIEVGFTEKSFIAKWDGTIKAGIDIEETDVSIDNINKTITISLPKATILSHEIDENSVETLDEKDGLFNPVKVEDVRVFDSESKIAMEERAIANGLLEKATENAKTILSELIKSNTSLENYKVIFKIV